MEFLEVGGIFLSVGRTEAQVRVDCDVGVVALLAKKGETPVVVLGELLNANSASGRSSAQLSCW